MPELLERIVKLETQQLMFTKSIDDLKSYLVQEISETNEHTDALFKELQVTLHDIKTSIDKVEEQTAKWKNIFWGVVITVSFFIGLYQEVSKYFIK
jgi:hypothetical protein